MGHKSGNVFPALSQRRQQDGEDVQTIIHITAKLPASHHLHQIAIGRGDQPDIHFVGAPAAQSLELLLLQHAQQLRLQRRGDVAYFVEKQRTFVSHFEASDLLRDGSGEGTLLMTEQFAFQKIQRNGRAIEFYKSAPATLTGVVNGVSDEFFSRASFPLNEDSRVRGRNLLHLLENTFERSTIADDPLERTLGLIRPKVHYGCVIPPPEISTLRLPTRLKRPRLLTHQVQHGPSSATNDDRTVLRGTRLHLL